MEPLTHNRHPHQPLLVELLSLMMQTRKTQQVATMMNPLKQYLQRTINSMNIPKIYKNNPRKTKMPLVQMIRRRLATGTAAPRSPTPPPLFCFFLCRCCVWGCCGGGRVRV
ncbi:hypothetical protein TcCL_NonESM04743, partial [Trypanosoma cruzi]